MKLKEIESYHRHVNILVEIKIKEMQYLKGVLRKEAIDPDPIKQFGFWYDEAFVADPDFSNSMTLSTVGVDMRPSSRVVLLKEFGEEGFVFYTNFNSRKGTQISENPNVSLCFFWKDLERQVRIEGKVVKLSSNLADQYFSTRLFESQVGAWVSDQSEVIGSREELDARFSELCSVFSDQEIKRPDYWGGYCVVPVMIEFWQGRPNRVNDRLRYSKTTKDGEIWEVERLAP